MDQGQLIVEAGRPEQMTPVEYELLKKGFSRVPQSTEPAHLARKQYTRRDFADEFDVFQNSATSVVLVWRE